ncbi:unnamed protein product [marine sediment metagenome]|uniref:Uncharacterized protein n=1 Tax=marine sediment metagenome TaxID=412755 RepID=X1RSR8_9ZZZZ
MTESVPLPGKAPEPPPGKETGKKDERKETGETVPSQTDLFKAEGKEELNRINEQEAMSLLN